MRWLSMSALAALAVVLAWPGDASADIWRCVGPGGQAHFTNSRPQGAAGRNCERVIRGSSSPRSSGARAPRARARGTRDASPDRYTRYDRHIREAARLYQLPESFIRAVMRVESDFSPEVVSHAGAMGLMQLMPQTAASMGVQDPFDPRQNILGGTRYLRILANKFNGDLVLTIAAYNAGEGAVLRYRGVPPYAETRRYVQRVLTYYYAFRGNGGS